MENGGNDDTRKKRDSRDVVERDAKQCEEKTKKLRAAKQIPVLALVESDNESYQPTKSANRRVLDLEVALQQIVNTGKKDESKEYLSETKWVQFRVGHASDASTLATFYRESRRNKRDERASDAKVNLLNLSKVEDTSLEIRLAEGLGDEDSPPSIFALLAEVVCGNGGDRNLVAAALVSSGWEDSAEAMIVKMLYVSEEKYDSDIADLLERRMWLRLSALALMTSNEMIVEQSVTKTSFSNIDSK